MNIHEMYAKVREIYEANKDELCNFLGLRIPEKDDYHDK